MSKPRPASSPSNFYSLRTSMGRKFDTKHSNIMQAANSQEAAVQPTASQQEEVEFLGLRRSNPFNERPIVTEPWQPCKQEETNRPFSPSILNSARDAYDLLRFHPSQQAPTMTTPNQAYSMKRQASQPFSQTASLQLPQTCLSAFDWNTFDDVPQTQTMPRHDAENGRLVLHQQHSSSYSASGSNNEFSTNSHTSGRGFGSHEDEAGRLKNIEESIHCFWLVSENRMRDVENELKDIAASMKGAHREQEQMGSQLSQILPLQVQIAQKVVRAADEKKIIFGRIKSLEESSAAFQKDMKDMMEAMQSELRSGLEMINEIVAAKGRRPSASKAKNEAAATSAPAASEASAVSAVPPTKNTNNKRPSPSRKKTSPAGAKKVKLPPADDQEDADAVANLDVAPASPPKPELAEPTQAADQAAQAVHVAQQQEEEEEEADYDHQHTRRSYQQHQHHHHYFQPRPQTASAWPYEYQNQPYSQPILPSHREFTFEQMQLLPRPHTAAPGCQHELRSNTSAIETAPRH